MAAGITYTPITSTTVASNTLSITFTSISQSYTDLVLVLSAYGQTGQEDRKSTRLNSSHT